MGLGTPWMQAMELEWEDRSPPFSPCSGGRGGCPATALGSGRTISTLTAGKWKIIWGDEVSASRRTRMTPNENVDKVLWAVRRETIIIGLEQVGTPAEPARTFLQPQGEDLGIVNRGGRKAEDDECEVFLCSRYWNRFFPPLRNAGKLLLVAQF